MEDLNFEEIKKNIVQENHYLVKEEH